MTRSQAEKIDIAQLTESITTLSTALAEFKHDQDLKNEAFLSTLQLIQTQLSDNKTLSIPTNPTPTHIDTPKPPKLILPAFDGSNPLEWIFQAEQFFKHYSIAEENRLSQISCYMAGDALGWFQWLHHNQLLTTWEEFTRALELRFGPSSFENHQQALFKLQQTGTVSDYQREFERLCNRVVGLSQPAILDCFLSGLRLEIHHELAILNPTSISQAIGLAKLVETKLQATKNLSTPTQRPYYPKNPSYSPSQISATSSSSPYTPKPAQLPPLLPSPPTKLAIPAPPPSKPPFPIKYLTSAEQDARRAKGLCFNCDERFHRGHRCKAPSNFSSSWRRMMMVSLPHPYLRLTFTCLIMVNRLFLPLY